MATWLIFKFILVCGISWWSTFISFASTSPVLPTPFIAETVLLHLRLLTTLSNINLMWIPACNVCGIVAETRQIHTDYWVLWRKRDSTATLSRWECLGAPRPHSQEESTSTLGFTGFYCFSGHITLRMVLISCAQVRFRWLQKTKERVLLIT